MAPSRTWTCAVAATIVVFTGWTGAANPPRSWPADPFLPVTLARIASLPDAEQPAWRAYFEKSSTLAAQLPAREQPGVASLQPDAGLLVGGIYSRGLDLAAPAAWFASAEAQSIADHVVAYQSPVGAWTKGNDYTRAPAPAAGRTNTWSGGTFDNDATTTEIRALARIASAAADHPRAAQWRESVIRGIHYCLDVQFPNGGIPQIYPLAGSYHDAITFNDDVMVHVLELFRDVADRRHEFGWVEPALRESCARALDRGVQCILATQLRGSDGTRTAWCQQYDALTMEPCYARNFEPVAASANESASLSRFLMGLPRPGPEVITAVESAIAWFKRTAIRDVSWDRNDPLPVLVARPGAPLLWARLYELGTDRPIFGDRDRTIHYVVDEISLERRRGYAWFGAWPAEPIALFAAWQERVR